MFTTLNCWLTLARLVLCAVLCLHRKLEAGPLLGLTLLLVHNTLLSFAQEFAFHHSHALPSILAWAQDCHTQSWRGHRIAPLNPGVDCHTQSWRGHRIAPVFPRKRWKRSAVQHYAPRLAARIARKTPAVRRYTPMHSRTRRPDCPENSASVLLCSSALTDSPPGFPASNFGTLGAA